MSQVESRTATQAARQVPQHPITPFPAASPEGWGGDPALGQTIERELVPRLLLSHRAGPFTPFERALVARSAAELSADDRHDFLESVLGPDEEAATALVRQLVARGVDIEAIYLDLLAPTAVQLGHLWDNDACDFLEVTIGLGRVQRVLRELSAQYGAVRLSQAPGGQILLSGIPGEQHTLGLYMVAEFFVRDGWGVQVGAPATDEELLDLVRDVWFDVIGFSVACESKLLKVRREIATVRRHSQNPRLVVLVGGRVFAENPELVARVGADGHAASAADAPACARDLLERRAG